MHNYPTFNPYTEPYTKHVTHDTSQPHATHCLRKCIVMSHLFFFHMNGFFHINWAKVSLGHINSLHNKNQYIHMSTILNIAYS